MVAKGHAPTLSLAGREERPGKALVMYVRILGRSISRTTAHRRGEGGERGESEETQEDKDIERAV